MQMSRHLEETRKTKFRRNSEEKMNRNGERKKENHRRDVNHKEKFDMWEDMEDVGC